MSKVKTSLILLTSREFHKFLVIGGALLCLEILILLWLQSTFELDPKYGRALSLTASIGLGWYLNRKFTFRNRQPAIARQLTSYYLTMMCSFALNYAAFAVVLSLFPDSEITIWIALFFGSASALMFNYFAMKWMIFKNVSP